MSRHFYGDIDIALVAFGGRRGGSLQQFLMGQDFVEDFLGVGQEHLRTVFEAATSVKVYDGFVVFCMVSYRVMVRNPLTMLTTDEETLTRFRKTIASYRGALTRSELKTSHAQCSNVQCKTSSPCF